MKKQFDCIIAGAGTAGCMLAKKLSEAGFSICLIDKKPHADIGHNWEVTIEKSIFSRVGLKLPAAEHIEENYDFARYYAKDTENYIEIPGSQNTGINIIHKTFNKMLLEKTLNSRICFIDNCAVHSLVTDIHDNTEGLIASRRRLLGLEEKLTLKAPVIVDASGTASVLRRSCPDSFSIKKKLRKQDFVYAWYELRELSAKDEKMMEAALDIHPGLSYTNLGMFNAFQAVHMRKNRTVSLIFSSSFSHGAASAKNLCRDFTIDRSFFGKAVMSAGGLIPVRRALDSLAGNGFLVIGDSACQAIPTMGSGVASSMHASDIAVRTITESLNSGDFTAKALWEYNSRYQRKRGAVLASYDIIRRFLQSLTLEETESIFKAHLLKDSNFLNTFSSNSINFNVSQLLENVTKILSNLNLFPLAMRFLHALSDSEKALKLYKNYPITNNSAEFTRWQNQTNELFSRYRTFSKEDGELFF